MGLARSVRKLSGKLLKRLTTAQSQLVKKTVNRRNRARNRMEERLCPHSLTDKT